MSALAALLMLQAVLPMPQPFPLGTLPRQSLPARGCAAYLFTVGDTPALVAVASADPAQLRLAIGGAITDLARAAQRGATAQGFAAITDYANGNAGATLELTVAMRADLRDGAIIPDAMLRLDRQGQDGVALPLTGMIACAPAGKR